MPTPIPKPNCINTRIHKLVKKLKKKPTPVNTKDTSVDHNSVNITFGNGKKRKPNKTAKRIKKNKQP